MPKKHTKKQTKKPKYPKELLVRLDDSVFGQYLVPYESPDHVKVDGEVAIYKFDRMAKVTRTVKVE